MPRIAEFPAVEFAVKAWKYKELAIHVPSYLRPLCEELNAEISNSWTSEEDARLDRVMFTVFAALFSPPPDARAIVAILTPLQMCWGQLYELCRLGQSTRTALSTSFDRFRVAIQRIANRYSNSQVSTSASPHRSYPVYRFHLDSSSLHSYRALGLYTAIQIYRIHLIRDLRYTECVLQGRDIKDLPNACLARSARIARELLRRCEGCLASDTTIVRDKLGPEYFTSSDVYTALYPNLIRPLFRIVRIGARGRKPLTSPTGNASPPTPRRPNNAQNSQSELPEDAGSKLIRTVTTRRSARNEDRTAIPKGELQTQKLQVPEPYPNAHRDAVVRAILNRTYETARAKSALPPLYDIRVMQLTEYVELFRRLPLAIPLETTSTADLIRSAIVLLSALMGHDASVTLTITADYHDDPSQMQLKDSEDTVHLVFHPGTESLYYLFPKEFLGYLGTDDHPFLQYCIPTSRLIQIPLFPPVNVLLSELATRQRRLIRTAEHDSALGLFAHPELPSETKSFVRHIDNWLQALAPSYRPNRWSLSRLSQSFQVHATRRFGVDAILAFYISCRRHWSVVSPSQYMAFPRERLFRAISNLQSGWSDILSKSGISWFTPTPQQATAFPAASLPDSDVWHGSRCVAQLQYLVRYFGALCHQLEQPWDDTDLRQLIDHHALFTLLAFRAWEFGTAMRPQRVPLVNPTTVDSSQRLTLLADKDSQYTEERFAMAPTLSTELMHVLRDEANPALFEGLFSLGPIDWKSYRKLQNGMFFFVDPQTKRFLPPKPSVLAQVQARFPSLAALYPYPPNIHRHLATTMLMNEYEADFELRNLFLGHKHFGHEPLHCYSGTDLLTALRILSTLLNHCLEQIGIRLVRWRP